jgi:hypothetical protein
VEEEVIEFYTEYLEEIEPIVLPRSRHEGRLQGVGIIECKCANVTFELR